MGDVGYTLGIDLGTTYSAAAVAADGRADRFPLGNRTASIPSVVCLREDGEVLVGEAAERRGLLEPTRTAREFKRRLGDPTPLLLGGTPYGAEALMAHLLTWIHARVVEQQGAAPDAVVLSHPANWGPFKLDLLEQTVRLSEIGDVTFLTEPEAAAVHYARQERLEEGEAVAVYDFGGGTFDAAVLRYLGDGFELVGTPEGMERIGGIDFDQAVFAHVDTALGGAVSQLDPDDSSAMAAVSRLRDECQLAKEQLSHDTDVDIPVLLPGVQTEVRLTRAEFESMIRPRVGETIRALERAVRSAELALDDVAKVLLVGGTSRIPLVGQLVREETGRPIAVDAHPKFAIAIGAALVGAAGEGRDDPATPAATAPIAPVAPVVAPTEPASATPVDHTVVSRPVDASEPLSDGADDEPAAGTAASTPDEGGTAASTTDEGTAPAADDVTETTTTSVRTGGRAGGSSGGDRGSGRPAWLLPLVGVLAVAGVVAGIMALGGGDPTDEPTIAAEPSQEAEPGDDPTSSDDGEETAPPDVAAEAVVEGITIGDDGTVEVRYGTEGFEPGDAGYGVELSWVDEGGTVLTGGPSVSAPGDGTFTFATTARPLPAVGVCLTTSAPDGEEVAEPDPEQCGSLDPVSYVDETTSPGTGMPGDRFVGVDRVTELDGTYVVDYTPYGYEPVLGSEGTWHVHFFFWPTSTEDDVGANVPAEERGSWAAWADPVFDAFAVADRPADATHICGVVAEYDHTISLQGDGSGYPSGTCVPLD